MKTKPADTADDLDTTDELNTAEELDTDGSIMLEPRDIAAMEEQGDQDDTRSECDPYPLSGHSMSEFTTSTSEFTTSGFPTSGFTTTSEFTTTTTTPDTSRPITEYLTMHGSTSNANTSALLSLPSSEKTGSYSIGDSAFDEQDILDQSTEEDTVISHVLCDVLTPYGEGDGGGSTSPILCQSGEEEEQEEEEPLQADCFPRVLPLQLVPAEDGQDESGFLVQNFLNQCAGQEKEGEGGVDTTGFSSCGGSSSGYVDGVSILDLQS